MEILAKKRFSSTAIEAIITLIAVINWVTESVSSRVANVLKLATHSDANICYTAVADIEALHVLAHGHNLANGFVPWNKLFTDNEYGEGDCAEADTTYRELCDEFTLESEQSPFSTQRQLKKTHQDLPRQCAHQSRRYRRA